MKKLLILICALLAVSTLSAQTYKVGDYYNVDGKKGIVFEVSEDGKHGKILAEVQPAEKMTWNEAVEFGKKLEHGWYIPSLEELQALLDIHKLIGEKLQQVGAKLPSFCWTTTEGGADLAWSISLRTDSRGIFYTKNKFNVCLISKF